MSKEIKEVNTEVVNSSGANSIMDFIGRMALDPNSDIDKIERLLAYREKEIARNSKMDFDNAMAKTQASILSIKHNKKNDHTKSTYADLDAVLKVAKPIYGGNGLSLSFDTKDSSIPGFIKMACTVSHDGGHDKLFNLDFPLDNVGIKGASNKTPIQAIKSSINYAQRTLTCMIFNISTGSDNDGNSEGVTKLTEFQEKKLKSLFDNAPTESKKKFIDSYGGVANISKENFDLVCAKFQNNTNKQ